MTNLRLRITTYGRGPVYRRPAIARADIYKVLLARRSDRTETMPSVGYTNSLPSRNRSGRRELSRMRQVLLPQASFRLLNFETWHAHSAYHDVGPSALPS